MPVLGISTSSRIASAAVMKDGIVVSCVFEDGKITRRSHSECLMELISKALEFAGISVSDIDSIAVDVGPGSFTGVRIGVNCANALAFALNVPVVSVCSLTALSLGSGDKTGTRAAIIDCRNGNCYAAVYKDGEESVAPCAAVTEDITSSLPEDAVISGDVFTSDEPAYPKADMILRVSDLYGIRTDHAAPMYLRPSQAERMHKTE